MNLLEGMLQKDQDEFRRICNKLINICFLCKQNETTRSDYYFVLKHKEKFEDFLGVLGYRIEINEEYGVLQLTNALNTNRQNLKLYESIILLLLRILFDEKKRELSISDEVIVNLGDIQDKFLSLKIREKMIDKTTMGNTLRMLRRYQLIELLDSDLKSEESRILIYNSILMAVRVEDIKRVYEKIETYRRGNQNDEETDQNEAD
jgi:hypothetical protein